MLTILLALAVQTSQPTDSQEVVVVGSRPMDRQSATALVNSTTQSVDGQLARFHEPICPLVLGMGEEMGRTISDQVRSRARELGAPVAADERCDANLILFASDDGSAMLRDIRQSYPAWFEGLSIGDLRALESEPGPVRTWSVTSLRNEDGQSLGTGSDTTRPKELRVKSASILNQPTQRYLDASIMVVDRPALIGKSLGQIADYLVMRGLAMTRPPSAAPSANTILNLFRGKAPTELTSFDRRYLAALYDGAGNRTDSQERRRMAESIAKQ